MKPYLLALCGALALVLAHEPYAAWPLAYVGLAAFAELAWMDGISARRRGLAAYLGGLVYFGVGCHWLTETAWFNLVGMTLPEATTFPATLLVARRVVRASPRWPRAVAFALAWGAVEFTRARFPFNGYPWLLVGNTHAQPLALAQAADLVGASGIGILLAFAGGEVREAWARRRTLGVALRAGALACAVPLGLAAYGALTLVSYDASRMGSDGPPPPVARVAIVQGNISQQLKHAPKTEREILAIQARGTRDAVRASETQRAAGESGVDLVCWAETMYPFPLPHDDNPGTWFKNGFGWADGRDFERTYITEQIVGGLMRGSNASLLIGAITCSGATPQTREDHNSAVLYAASGTRVARYSKSILVPGGEFIPLRSCLPAVVDAWVEAAAGFLPRLAPGDGPRAFDLPLVRGGHARFATTICYENVYPSYAAAVGALDVDFVINLSNEGWFGASAEFDQMDASTRLRAIEMRLPVVRATNTGVSAVYDAAGRRTATLTSADGSDRSIEGVLIANVPRRSGSRSLFVRTGDAFAWLCSIVALLGFLRGSRRRSYLQPGSR